MNLTREGGRAVLVLAALSASAVAAAAEHIDIKSVHVTLPASTEQFPAGPGSELAGQCQICHSAAMVLNQPSLTEEEWKAIVNKMRKAYGAPVAEADVDAIAMYMAQVSADRQGK
jgi:mono/diheme cytochrome c family protein